MHTDDFRPTSKEADDLVQALRCLLRVIVEEVLGPVEQLRASIDIPSPLENWTWREQLWVVPSETRLGVQELVEAVGRPESWVYRHTSANASTPLPHRKLDGRLAFVAGEIRAWLREHEEVLQSHRSELAAWEMADAHVE